MHIHQDQVVAGLTRLIHRNLAVFSQINLKANAGEQFQGNFLIDQIIFGQKNAVAPTLPQAVLSFASGQCRPCGLMTGFSNMAVAQRRFNPEGAAASGFAVHADDSTHQFDQPPRNGQTQPGAAIFAGRRSIGLLEGPEQAALLFGR